MKNLIIVCLMFFTTFLSCMIKITAQNLPDNSQFERVSTPAEMPFFIAFQKQQNALQVQVKVESLPDNSQTPLVKIGVAGADSVVMDSRQAKSQAGKNSIIWTFIVPFEKFAPAAADFQNFKVAGSFEIPGGPYGQAVYKMRFGHQDYRAPHADMSVNPSDWSLFNLAAYFQRVEDRKAMVFVSFDQPADGKASVVINDSTGKRVRNLVGGLEFSKGKNQVEWDGLDDDGNVVQPGKYNWKSIHHTGIKPEFLFSFCNDGNPPWKTGSGEDMWGPDHSCITTVEAIGDKVYFLSPCAEAGYQGAITDLQGVKRMTFGTPTPVSKFAFATDGKMLYTAADNGVRMVLVRYLPGKDWVPFGNKQKEIEVGKAAMNGFGKGDSSFSQANWDAFDLAGFTIAGGKLAVSSRAEKGIIIFDAESGNREKTIPLADPGALAAAQDGSILAVSAGAILRIAADGMTTTLVADGKIKPGSMTCSKDGKLYVIDNATCQIVILNAADGRETGRLGVPGGAYAGTYNPERMVNPLDLTIADNGWLWVTENRYNPKRVLAWDLKTGKVVKEKFGSTAYGASGGGFDSVDATRWVGQGAAWKVDLEKRTAIPASILFADAQVMPAVMHWRFLHRDNRTFLLGYNSCTSLVELKPDGSGQVLAQFGSAQGYCLGLGDRIPPIFLETFYKVRGFDTPEKRKRLHEGRLPHQNEYFVWSDHNGDGSMQADELEFADRFGGGYWGSDFESLDIVVPLFKDLGGRPGMWRMEMPLLGWYPSGAPRWKPLAEAETDAKQTEPAFWGNESTLTDRNGVLYMNAHDKLLAQKPDLSVAWTYPNKWAGVHGSHDAPLPEPGKLQGSLFFLGSAPLDDKSDVFIINGNHGRFFAFTSDGFYLDEFFKDVRMGAFIDAYMIGGECFGGFFGKNMKDGKYYLQSGHTDYRIFKMNGLDSVVRSKGGEIEITPQQVEAFERRKLAKKTEIASPKEIVVPFVKSAPAMDGSGKDWPGILVKWDKSGQFMVNLQAAYDSQNLYLRYAVEDASPWINNGQDEKMLFKTGDCVDLQIGTNPAADPGRTAAVPGDIRLMAAPSKGQPVAMLYRYRVPGTTAPTAFSSPWRTEKIDEVKKLSKVKINVTNNRIAEGKYGYFAELAIPFDEIGLKPEAGKKYRVDFGVIYGDPSGQMNQLRSYWSNQATGLVNDVPGEIMLFPNLWGTLTFEERK